LSISNIY